MQSFSRSATIIVQSDGHTTITRSAMTKTQRQKMTDVGMVHVVGKIIRAVIANIIITINVV